MTKPKSFYAELDRQAPVAGDRWLPTGAVAARYYSSPSTLARWAKHPEIGFPAPIKFTEGGGNFWSAAERAEFDRRRAAQAPELRARASERRKAGRAPPSRRRKTDPHAAYAGAADTSAAAMADQHMHAQEQRQAPLPRPPEPAAVFPDRLAEIRGLAAAA